MERQERAFTVWLNAVLQPTDEVLGEENSLAAKRAAAKVRGLLWRLYSEDDGVVSTMLRLEQRIDSGFMRMKEEVAMSISHYTSWSISHTAYWSISHYTYPSTSHHTY